MSLSEEQIVKLVHKELKRILDIGLMYTEEADMQAKNYPAVPKSTQVVSQQPKIEPTVQTKQVNDQGVHWTEQTPTAKGPWEKTTETSPQLNAIEDAIHAKQRPQFVDGALYWMIEDKETGQPTGVGRRIK
jgi:hypothetical protein